jgi:DNA topoisomerase VI subunit B
MSAATTLQRTMFETSRAVEYFNVTELEAQTGQPKNRFLDVVEKELLDNACDVCEAAGVAPDVLVEARWRDGLLHLSIEDNGPGIAPRTVQRILNFATRTSDKMVYRAPTRGTPGNGLKTVIGLPYALGSQEPVIIEAQGVRHSIKPWIDPGGGLHLGYTTATVQRCVGTRVHVALPLVQSTRNDKNRPRRGLQPWL